MSCQKPKDSDYPCPVESGQGDCTMGDDFMPEGRVGWRCSYLKENVTLRIPISKKWFERIRSGSKKIEYREYKPFWISRIEGRDYDFIEFRCGYRKDAKRMIVVWKGYTIIKGIQTPLGSMKQFAINLGEVCK
jgi:hypothetical protein